MPALKPFPGQSSAFNRLHQHSLKVCTPKRLQLLAAATLHKWHKANQRWGLAETTLYDRVEVVGLDATYFYFRDRNWDRR